MFSFINTIGLCNHKSTNNVINPVNTDTDMNSIIIPSQIVANVSDITEDWNWKTTKPFIPPVSGGKCIKVYDGDTITIATKIPFDKNTHKSLADTVYRFSVRLNGIDSPEIKGHTITEKAMALVARDELKKKILDKHVTLKNVSTEKYGRLLADVYVVDDKNTQQLWLNKWMLDNKYAVFYDGDTKKIPEDWI